MTLNKSEGVVSVLGHLCKGGVASLAVTVCPSKGSVSFVLHLLREGWPLLVSALLEEE